MARPIKIKESDLTNMVKRILAERGVVNEEVACNPPFVFCHDCVGGNNQLNCEGFCGGNPECYTIDFNKTVGSGGTGVSSEGQWEATLKKHDPKGTYKNYKKMDHKGRSEFDGRKSKVVGVDSNIKDQRFEKNIAEGYKKFGCKFLQSRKSLNEDKLTSLLTTNRDIREQKTLSRKLRFIESAIGLSKCGTILKEQKEGTSISRNDYRRVRKLIYENMDWEGVRYHNNKRIQNIKRNGRIL